MCSVLTCFNHRLHSLHTYDPERRCTIVIRLWPHSQLATQRDQTAELSRKRDALQQELAEQRDKVSELQAALRLQQEKHRQKVGMNLL